MFWEVFVGIVVEGKVIDVLCWLDKFEKVY